MRRIILSRLPPSLVLEALNRLQLEANSVWGATAPNPPVAALLMDADGQILASAAHPRAGEAHAELLAIEKARVLGLLTSATSLWVTLEPCNHHGRTPPCTEAILNTKIPEIITVFADLNPAVLGGGHERLRKTGRTVTCFADLDLPDEQSEVVRSLARPLAGFFKFSKTGLPYVVIKTAEKEGFSRPESMIPPPGQKTFSRESSLTAAHELRKHADAILTGSGTILADQPEFTVRKVPDHVGKIRRLGIADRQGRVSKEVLAGFKVRGFLPEILDQESFESVFRRWGKEGVREVMVEAGPTLTQAILDSRLWDEHVVVRSGPSKDEIVVTLSKF